MAYLYKLYIVVDDDVEDASEDLIRQNAIDQAIDEKLSEIPNTCYCGARILDLDTNNNGRCCKCGAWVSDQSLPDSIDGFSDGCIINGEWYCDLCLPDDHPKHF